MRVALTIVVMSGMLALVVLQGKARSDEFSNRYEAAPSATAPQGEPAATGQNSAASELGPAASQAEKDWWVRWHYHYHYYYRPVYYTYYYYPAIYYTYGTRVYYYWDGVGKRHEGTDPAKLREEARRPLCDEAKQPAQ